MSGWIEVMSLPSKTLRYINTHYIVWIMPFGDGAFIDVGTGKIEVEESYTEVVNLLRTAEMVPGKE
jgi:hypothetical protein